MTHFCLPFCFKVVFGISHIIIFFDWINDDGTQDGVSDHTGIVERVDINENKVYTIEGNSGDACKEQSYSLDSVQIMGYGIPNM